QAKQAVPYLNKFLKGQPDDATLLEIRDRFGVGSILRLDDYPETRAQARQLVDKIAEASHRNATRAERIQRFVAALTKSQAEQDYAVEQLREAGPYAVPFLVQALEQPGMDVNDRALIVRNMGRLDRSVVPALIAALDSPDVRLAADVADVLGKLGDRRAIPHLTYLAAQADTLSPVRSAARRAIANLTNRSYESQPRSAARLLTDEARKYHIHTVHFPSDPVVIWAWDDSRKAPAPQLVSKSEAEAFFGLRLAREALKLEPGNVDAQVQFLSLALEKAVERVGFTEFPAKDPSNTLATALAAGPNVLAQVLRTAIADKKTDLAAVAAMALGQVTDRDALATDRRVSPLVEALSAPGRRVQFAATRALVALDPGRPFAGSSRVVPVLARFLVNQPASRAVVIDGNAARGGQLVGFLRELGYEPVLAATGDQGFRTAAESADVELILIDPHLVQGNWRLIDTLSNLKADSRTAGIPVYVVGPLNLDIQLNYLASSFPGLKFLVTPTSAALLEQQLGGRPTGLSDDEKAGYAREAAQLLAQLSAKPGSPFEPDLKRIEPALAAALNNAQTSLAASAALGDVPDPSAQRGLADALLDPSKPAQMRLGTAYQLTRSIQRFGPLVSADQEVKLVTALNQEADPVLQTALAAVIGALRPKPASAGRRLQQYNAPVVVPPQPGVPGAATEVVPAPPTPDAAPPAAAGEKP
ncbi:MAG TPA: HEAT repeat domain-containing protein, partial [Isosphaeraceae bacterium]|nr:HEAT repeat domain-containing protein [Isosphaeraceae bacterium]